MQLNFVHPQTGEHQVEMSLVLGRGFRALDVRLDIVGILTRQTPGATFVYSCGMFQKQKIKLEVKPTEKYDETRPTTN
jgi:hypothetical protein